MADGDRLLLSGNEAIALGAFEAGVKVASAYPGTPSTEILENLTNYEGVYCEWAPNEKVALEVALGASFAGVRALATMKHVGLNVAADPLFTAAYTGVRGGLVIVTADDPSMHSSQNEQDNRNYAFAAKLPMLEPSDPAEAKEFLKLAYAISEEFDTPVLLRTTTRVAHVKGLVRSSEAHATPVIPGIHKDPSRMVMLPGNARKRRVVLEDRMIKIRDFSRDSEINRVEEGTGDIGFITSGVSYLYVKEAFPDAPVLKLGMCWPIPGSKIIGFASGVKKLYVIEELDPFLETHIRALDIELTGKEVIPSIGELSARIVREAIAPGTSGKIPFKPVEVPMRPPNMCPGCPHRGLFHVLSKLKVFVSGDIGCYTLGALPPLTAMDSCVCMGASVGIAHGMDKALGKDAQGKIVGVIGDSTFAHSGITGLLDIVYNKGISTIIILDNRITAMTGQQQNPVSGMTLSGEPTRELDLEALCKALGINHVRTVNPHDIPATRAVLEEELATDEPSVIITKAPCVLLPDHKAKAKERGKYQTIEPNCKGCRACINIGCPAIQWVPLTPEEAVAMGYKDKQKGHSLIDQDLCDGCGQCFHLCKFDAIHKAEVSR